jgi:hypothetical protein
MEGVRASAKGREGKVSQFLSNYPIKEIVCMDLAIASSGLTGSDNMCTYIPPLLIGG